MQVDDSGEIIKGVFGALGGSYPQTPLGSEYAGMSVAYDNAKGCDLVMDCQAVINGWRKGFGEAMVAGSPFDHWWKTVFARHHLPDRRIKQIVKVKAHRSLAQVPDCPIELHRFKGNAKVDEYAKLGAETHPVDQEEADEYIMRYKDVKKVAKHVVSTLALRPPGHIDIKKTGKKCRRRARLGSTHSKAHDFVWCQKTWVCAKCLDCSRCPIFVNSSSPSCAGLSVMSSIF